MGIIKSLSAVRPTFNLPTETELSFEETSQVDERKAFIGSDEEDIQTIKLPIQIIENDSSKHGRPRYLAAGMIVAIIVFAAASLTIHFGTMRTSTSIANCGSSPEEAAANGCVFDMMNYLWVPPACFDEQTHTESYQLGLKHHGGPYRWFLDANGTEEISSDIASLSRHTEAYVSHDWHVGHCLYSWKLLHRAILNHGSLVNSVVAKYGHTLHCDNAISSTDWDMSPTNTLAVMGYAACVNMFR